MCLVSQGSRSLAACVSFLETVVSCSFILIDEREIRFCYCALVGNKYCSRCILSEKMISVEHLSGKQLGMAAEGV